MPSFGLRGRSTFRGVPDPDAKSAMHEMRTIIFFMDYLIYGLWASFLSFIFFADNYTRKHYHPTPHGSEFVMFENSCCNLCS